MSPLRTRHRKNVVKLILRIQQPHPVAFDLNHSTSQFLHGIGMPQYISMVTVNDTTLFISHQFCDCSFSSKAANETPIKEGCHSYKHLILSHSWIQKKHSPSRVDTP